MAHLFLFWGGGAIFGWLSGKQPFGVFQCFGGVGKNCFQPSGLFPFVHLVRGKRTPFAHGSPREANVGRRFYWSPRTQSLCGRMASTRVWVTFWPSTSPSMASFDGAHQLPPCRKNPVTPERKSEARNHPDLWNLQ